MFGAAPLPRTLEAALRDLSADKPAVRAAAVRDLAAAHTRSPSPGARPDASEGDGGSPPSRPADQVVRALQRALRDDEAQVRAAAATALADVGAGEALPDLLLAVEDDNSLVRQMAISALGEIGDPRATERLRRALGDSRAEVRFQAVMAFPRVCASPEDGLTALLRATEDEDPLVCHIALRMTDELRAGVHDGGSAGSADSAGSAPKPPVHDGGSAGSAPRPPDERVLARARALLGHASAEVRVVSAILLAGPHAAEKGGPGGTARRKVVEVLTQVGRGELRTRDREDEAAAVELCGELGLTAARAGLERRAFGGLLGLRRDPLAWHARVALARMGHERACREILRELGDRDRDVCTLAVAAAGRARLVAARESILSLRGDARRADPHAVDEALAALAVAPAPTSAPTPA